MSQTSSSLKKFFHESWNLLNVSFHHHSKFQAAQSKTRDRTLQKPLRINGNVTLLCQKLQKINSVMLHYVIHGLRYPKVYYIQQDFSGLFHFHDFARFCVCEDSVHSFSSCISALPGCAVMSTFVIYCPSFLTFTSLAFQVHAPPFVNN